MSENDMEEKILAYLLGECSGEEAFEVEKLCREDPSWQVEKIRLGQVIGLVKESLTDGIDGSLPENECRLSTKQKEEIKALLDNPLSKKDASKEKEEIMAEPSKTKNPKLIYWAPLAAAAIAALIAYWGNPEKDNAKKAKASYASVPKSENNISAEIVDESSQVVASAKTKTSDILPADSNSGTLPVHAEVALQESITASANQTLALRTKNEIKALEQQAIEQLPDGKELMKRIKDSNISSDQPDSDELLALAQKDNAQDSLNYSFSSPSPHINSKASRAVKRLDPKPSIESKEIKGSIAEQDQSTASSIPQRKADWKSVLQAPETSFIFNEKGDSLGKILIHESGSGTEIIFERTNWLNKNRNFKLLPGTYEIRLSKQNTGTLILKGTLKPSPESEKYLFIPSLAWELDSEEKRKSLPLDSLNP
jgi:hypothetical protein